MSLNRIVILVGSLFALAAGLLPVVANLDWTSTAGVLVSLGAVASFIVKWLDGWQKFEEREHYAVLPPPDEPDQGDAGK